MRFVFDSLFGPIARLSIARGVRFADVAEHLRLAFFRAAKAAAGPGATDSRLSVLSGLQRRDIARMRAQEAPPEQGANPLARLVAVWRGDPRYGGRPLARKGEGSFDALAAEIRKDVHPRAMLDQLEASGTVGVENETVTLLADAYQPLAGSEDQLAYLARNVGDHLEASVGNVLDAPLHLERAVHYNQLSEEAVAELDAMWRAQVGEAMAAVNARALVLQDRAPGRRRFRAGAYFWQEDEA